MSLQVMFILLLLVQLCLKFKYLLLFRGVISLFLGVMSLLPEPTFLLMECIMGHLMGCLMDLIMGRSMDTVIHLMGTGINNSLTLLIMAL